MTPSFDNKELRAVLGCFATGVTVVTTELNNECYGMTVTSFASVSLDPPLVLWSLDEKSNTYDVFSSASYYNIHILTEDQESLSNQFASSLANKFSCVDYAVDENGVPVIKSCAALLRCQLETTISQGDHLIIIGRVLSVEKEPDADLLIFAKGNYASLAKPE